MTPKLFLIGRLVGSQEFTGERRTSRPVSLTELMGPIRMNRHRDRRIQIGQWP